MLPDQLREIGVQKSKVEFTMKSPRNELKIQMVFKRVSYRVVLCEPYECNPP